MSETTGQIGVVILAAGASTRMGEPKQLLPYEGHTLLRRSAEAALASGCGPVAVVLGAAAERTRAEVEALPVRLVVNEAWSGGLSTSVRAGVEALESEPIDAILFAPCDQPALEPAVLDRLAAEFRRSRRPIVASGYDGAWGVPMLFARPLWGALKTLRGDEGARRVALTRPEEVACVPFPGGARDVDTRDDYRALLERAGALRRAG